ncbi:protein O-mannosyl-transferase TMTC4-like [Haliotis rufescens]|uniref:protein O-mannosyl-transferase TMTC4-like n=1 Tax=Haliotis rufescens TaxID=6454 RepID=UPI00201F7DF1|nr:protein O-mannosyl-transferase TMTC4-like [Haliotis rufescens]
MLHTSKGHNWLYGGSLRTSNSFTLTMLGERPLARPSKARGNSYQSEWDDVLPVPKLSFSVASVLVFCLAVLCFVNSHDGDFVFDDTWAITKNRDILPETPLTAVFAHDFWGQLLDEKSHKSYRPLTVMTYRWNYAWAGGLHPRGFHVVNIVLHGLVSVIFLAVFSVLMSGYQVDQESARPVFASPRAALLCAVLFAVHPIHTESIAGVVGRADLLCALTFLLSFLLYARACVSSSSLVSYRPESFSLVSVLASMCLCVVSTFCKEQGITVIGICSVFDIVVVCRVDPFQLMSLRKHHIKSKPKWVLSFIKRHLVLLLTGVILLISRLWIMRSSTPNFSVDDNPHTMVNGTLLKILNYNYLYAMNSWLLLNPWWLCFDWSMGCIPVITSLADPRILAVMALWTGCGALFYHCYHGELTSYRRILIVSLATLGVPFLPASNLFFRVGFVIAERILYLSCAGFCMLVVLGARQICHQLQQHCMAKKVVSGWFVLLVVVFFLRSTERCKEYREELTLFTSGLKVCPMNAKVHYNLARLHTDINNTDIAIHEFREALKLKPQHVGAMNNLATILRKKGALVEAEELLERAVSVRPDHVEAWMNLGVLQAELNQTESADASFRNALLHCKVHTDCMYDLGNLYWHLGRHTEAIDAFHNVTQGAPTHTAAWVKFLQLLDVLEKYDHAIEVGEKALAVLKYEPELTFRLANIYLKKDKYKESEKLLLVAIQRDPQNPYLHLNLGVLYYRIGNNEKSEKAYLIALKLAPNDPLILKNLQALHRKMGKIPPVSQLVMEDGKII